MKLYINGVQETSFSTETYPSQNTDFFINNNQQHSIATRNDSPSGYWDGYLCEIILIDGQALDPTSFGEFDEDSGIWKPIDVSGLTFGTNGFYLDFENSGSLGADVSGNGNNFTVNNLTAIDQTTDTPTNNFATLNPLDNYYAGATFSEGNLKVATNTSNYTWNTATIGLSQGKWYWEVKYVSVSGGNYNLIGITEKPSSSSTGDVLGLYTYSYAYHSADGHRYANGNDSAYGNSYTTGDIIGIALDLDNNKLYFAKNGTWQNSGDPTSGATGTGAISITDSASTNYGVYIPAIGDYGDATSVVNDINFGNPTFTISSGNSDGNGYGNFEYAVPSGYLSLCTANISEVLG
jgi:hypothetical protein